jgi:hypothetical protein
MESKNLPEVNLPEIKKVKSIFETLTSIAAELKINPEHLKKIDEEPEPVKEPAKRGRPRKVWPEVSDKAFELLYIVLMFRQNIDRCLTQLEISKIMNTSIQVVNHHVKFLRSVKMISVKNGIKITASGIQYTTERIEKERQAESERIKIIKSIGPIFSKNEIPESGGNKKSRS